MKHNLQGGSRVYGQGPVKFGYKTLPNDGSKFFYKGKETRFWSTSGVPRYVDEDDINVIRDVAADDGSYGGIILPK
jgi:hypothetical protein